MEPIREDERRRRRRGGWLWMLLALLLAILIASLVAAFRHDGDSSSSKGAGAVKGAHTSLVTKGTLTAGSMSVFGSTALAALMGRPVTANRVTVTSVVGDEVFWLGSGAKRVLVQLTHTGNESAPTVRAGDRVSFTGTVVRNGSATARSLGITKHEDASLYARQKAHVKANVSTLSVVS